MPDQEPRYITNGNNKQVKLCAAQLGDGRQCNAAAMRDKDFCKHHGGKALVGPDSPTFKTGLWSQQRKRFSTVAPQLLEKIEALREDPDLYSLRDDTAYITAVLDIRAEAASYGISKELYEELRDQYNVCRVAPEEAFSKEFKKLGTLISNGIDSSRASDDVLDLIKKRADVIEIEQRMAHAKSYTLEVDQAYSLIMQILNVVKQTVRDPEQVRAISEGFAKILKVHQSDAEEILDAEVIS
jgi:hypothetical protein